MNLNDIQKASVIGGGTMGSGIVQVFAATGYDVTLIDVKQEYLDRAQITISKSMDRFIKKGAMTEDDKKAALGRLTDTTDMSAVKDAQLVIEAVTERLDKLEDENRAHSKTCRPQRKFFQDRFADSCDAYKNANLTCYGKKPADEEIAA